MHDPCTQAFVIPWRYRWSTLGSKPWKYWEPLITIWHRDPEKGGSDDSCGWFTPPLTETQREIVKTLAMDEAREPWFAALDAKYNTDPMMCEVLLRGAFLVVSRCMENRGCLRRPVTLEEATKWAELMTHNSVDNFRSSLCFKSGWHSNWYREGVQNSVEQDKWFREENAKGFFRSIAGYILRERRPWYQHPKWHFWHWSIQIHPTQMLKRWMFSRCCKCGEGFKWGESVYSGWGGGTGPRWFRSEKGIWHGDCDPSAKPTIQPGMANEELP